MTPAWAQRREELLRDCLVSPDVFHQMVDRLGEFVVPYQQALETEAGQRNVHLYLQGLLSHLPGKNAEDIATFVDVQRQVVQAFIGTAPWDHRPLIEVLVGQVSVSGVVTEAKSTIARSASSWDTSVASTMPCSTFACPCPRSGHGTSTDAKHATCHEQYVIKRDTSSV